MNRLDPYEIEDFHEEQKRFQELKVAAGICRCTHCSEKVSRDEYTWPECAMCYAFCD